MLHNFIAIYLKILIVLKYGLQRFSFTPNKLNESIPDQCTKIRGWKLRRSYSNFVNFCVQENNDFNWFWVVLLEKSYVKVLFSKHNMFKEGTAIFKTLP